MNRYLLLLHERQNDFSKYSPEEMQKIIMEYRAWATGLAEAGRMFESHKLTDEGGKVLRRADGELLVTDGPYSETKEIIGGYFVIGAETYEEAVRIAAGCPHISFGGTVEVRQIDALGEE